MTQLMTQAEFARHRGVSKGSVTNWKNAGFLIMQEDSTGRIKVNVERSEARLHANIDPVRGRPSTGGQAPAAVAALPGGETSALPLGEGAVAPVSKSDDFAQARLEESRERRTGQALKNAQTAGELVPLIEAERRVSEIGRAMRERMHAWLRSNAERFAAEKDVRQIMSIGENGIDEVFAELADAAARGDFAGGDDDLDPAEVAEMEAVGAESEE